MYQYLLFDLDGTLTDPGIGITNSVMHALRKFGIEAEERSALYPFIGPPLRESFQKYYGFTPEQSSLAVTYYREYFSVKGLYENEVYEQIPAVLEALRSAGRRLFVATAKPELFSVKILRHFGLDGYFDFIAGATMDETRVEKAEVIRYALETCAIPPEEALMIGDRANDILGARENGLDSLGVLYGYGSREELTAAGASFLAERPEDILRFI